MIKFDGVGELDLPDPEPRPYNRIEYAYSRVARKAGIDMAETFLLEERSLGHFMTKRFDRTGDGSRLHLHTLGGMEHVDYNRPGLYSYEQYLRLILFLELGYPAMEEAFRRICFNIMTVNQDDHVKNLGFLMDRAGRWSLSPAYDLTFARGRGYTRRHQMSLGGKFDRFASRDLLDLGDRFGISGSGREILEQVRDALSFWPEAARDAGVPMDRVQATGGAFRLL
jgi:serine/threonine-protein kinase HipA